MGPTEQEVELADERAATTKEKLDEIDEETAEIPENKADPAIADFIRRNQ